MDKNEYEVTKIEIKSTIQKLLEVIKFYGKSNWRDISLDDRGEKARVVYKQITGKQVWEE
jgi:hypothetical protein